jgi:hypothetical protein
MKRILILLFLFIALPSYAMNITMMSGGGTSAAACTAQTITWNTQPAAMTVGDADQTLNQATSDSGLTIAYTTNNSGICTIVSSKLHAVGDGLCVVSANQSGNGTYCAAEQANSGNVAISAGCTTPTGDDFGESFESCSTWTCDKTWTAVGTGTNEVVNTSTITGTVGNNTACTKSYHFSASASDTYIKWNRGSAYDVDSGTGYTIKVYFNLKTGSDTAGEAVDILQAFASDGSDLVARIIVYNESGTQKVLGGGSSSSTGTTLSLNTWYTLILHIDEVTTDNTFQVCDKDGANCGTAYTFARTASRDFRYLRIGGNGVSAGELMEGYIGFVYGEIE